MSAPQRIRLSRAKGFKLPPDTVKVTRPGPFGNPFRITKGTSTTGNKTVPAWIVDTPDQSSAAIKYSAAEANEVAVTWFRYWLHHSSIGREIARLAKLRLKGKNLACFCKLEDACHADVLLEIANAKEAV